MDKIRNLSSRRLLFVSCAAALTALLFGNSSFLRRAQTVSAQREVKINTFNGLPVEITEVRNLQKGGEWFSELEIEVKNVSDRPVYGIVMTIVFPDIPASPPAPRADGRVPAKVETGFPLKFGPARLLDLSNLATPEDTSIKPGETYVFKMPPERVKGLESMKARHGFTSADIKRIELHIDVVSFGDGTGYLGPRKKDYRGRKSGQERGATPGGPRDTARPSFNKLAAAFEPVAFTKISRSPPTPARQLTECTGGCAKYVIRYGSEQNGSAYCTPPDWPNSPVCWRDEAIISSSEDDCTRYTSEQFDCGEGVTCGNDRIDFEASASCAQFTPCHDFDNDGYRAPPCGDDCDDTKASVHPLQLENCTDPANNDCDDNVSDDTDPECQTSCPSTDCNPATGNEFPVDYCAYPGSGCPYPYQSAGACCQPPNPSPVLVDVDGSGFRLTGAADGVWFDFYGRGTKIRLAWTAASSTNAWLALDQDGNGTIDSGRELFGNMTPQPLSDTPHGFLALAEYDSPARGGNGDGVVDSRDAVFQGLRLWRDANHDGISQPAELHTLHSLDVARLQLDYKESKRTDKFGNQFHYRAKVEDAKGAKVGRWAWDVFLVRGQ